MKVLSGLLLVASMLPAQDFYRKHKIHIGLGSAQPRGELKNALSDSFLVEAGYGYRFHRYFQIDVGFDTIFGAAGTRDFLPTQFGNLRIRDYQYLLPIGAAVVVPIAGERIHFTAGGGGAYMRYSERIRQPFGDSGFRLDCDLCAARDGWGYYGKVAVDVAIDRAQNFRIGVGSRVFRGETEGDAFGNVPRRVTRDRWVNIFGTFGFSF